MCVKRRQHWILLLTWMFETVLFFVVNQQSHILHGFKLKSKVTVFTWMFCVMFVMFVFFQDETVTDVTWI